MKRSAARSARSTRGSALPAKPAFFATPADFRRWLERHHDSAAELWVGYHKKATGRASITWSESVDEALCFGWIDGVRKSVDENSYMNRFTPRRRGSNWSAVNVRRARDLIAAGRMTPAGLAAFEARDPVKSDVEAEERRSARLDADAEATFRRNRAAWRFFESQPPGYRQIVVSWVMSAKRPETRARRLETLIADSAAGRKIAPLRRPGE